MRCQTCTDRSGKAKQAFTAAADVRDPSALQAVPEQVTNAPAVWTWS